MGQAASRLFSSENGMNEASLFRQLSTEIATMAKDIGVTIVPFRDESLPHFSKLSALQRQRILNDLGTYVRICQSTVAQGYRLDDSARFLWAAIKEFNFRPTSDLFQYVPEGRVIEIHNTEFVQIFRNFEFYTCCSYSLEEIYGFPWTYLYTRNAAVEQAMIKTINGIFEGKIQTVVPMNLEPHVIKELFSPLKFEVQAQMKYIAPLFEDKTGQVAAHLLIEEGHVLNLPRSAEEQTRLLDEYYKNGRHQMHLEA